jgi:hypothetical protein
VAKFYQRIRARKGSAITVTAASAKMLRIIYWVLRERRAYHGSGLGPRCPSGWIGGSGSPLGALKCGLAH